MEPETIIHPEVVMHPETVMRPETITHPETVIGTVAANSEVAEGVAGASMIAMMPWTMISILMILMKGREEVMVAGHPVCSKIS